MFTKTVPSRENTFENMLADVESSAAGLSEEEVFAIIGIIKDDMEEDKLKQVMGALLRGKARANKKAVDLLFQQMGSKGGEKACIDYLKRFAAEWPVDGEYESGKSQTFKVIMDDD